MPWHLRLGEAAIVVMPELSHAIRPGFLARDCSGVLL